MQRPIPVMTLIPLYSDTDSITVGEHSIGICCKEIVETDTRSTFLRPVPSARTMVNSVILSSSFICKLFNCVPVKIKKGVYVAYLQANSLSMESSMSGHLFYKLIPRIHIFRKSRIREWIVSVALKALFDD